MVELRFKPRQLAPVPILLITRKWLKKQAPKKYHTHEALKLCSVILCFWAIATIILKSHVSEGRATETPCSSSFKIKITTITPVRAILSSFYKMRHKKVRQIFYSSIGIKWLSKYSFHLEYRTGGINLYLLAQDLKYR